MEYLIIGIIAFLTAGFALFSGFGIGTVLTPVFALFFPVPVAIAITAIVHFLNNLFKMIIFGKFANKEVVLKFGIPSIFGAAIGAKILSHIAQKSFILKYQIMNHQLNVELVNFIIGVIILLFALYEILPQKNKLFVHSEYLTIGGVLSGFLGGLSGYQGALRSIFLIKSGLDKIQFIATSISIAIIVDIIRLLIYGTTFFKADIIENIPLIILAVLSAFLGTYFARKIMYKVTIKIIRIIIFIMLLTISTGLITGII